MRLSVSKSQNSTSLYVIDDVYVDGKRTTKVVERLGTIDELRKKLDGQDPIEWAKEYIADLNRKEALKEKEVILKFTKSKQIKKEIQNSFNGGYLFLQKIYSKLKINDICKQIQNKYKFSYDLNEIMSRLIYGRILFPSSKLNTLEESKKLIEGTSFDLQHVYRALEVIAKETNFIQSQLYLNSKKAYQRKDRVLYYDCTNYFFEIENESGIRKYGVSKDNKPNPIVGMGLFMDADGVPLAFNIFDGNTNEQITLQPLEKQILNDFEMSKFIVCTDAGLSSASNRRFNDRGNRAYVTTQSVKKLKDFLKEWALDPKGWSLAGSNQKYDLSKIEKEPHLYEKFLNSIFHKERWIKENGVEEKLVVSFSFKYKNYQENIRNRQIHKAVKTIAKSPQSFDRKRQTDYKRFIKKEQATSDGELATTSIYSLDEKTIEQEVMFDGFYAVCTNLEDKPLTILAINHRRWQIEECFRLMKSEFKARPVYLSRDDRIHAHFTTCFLALTVYRFLEKELKHEYTTAQILACLKEMNFNSIHKEGYIPTYRRTDLTDKLHEFAGFRTDYEIIDTKEIKHILRLSKKR